MFQQVTLIGHLGRDPETRYMPDGGAVTNLSVATSERWKDKNGDKQERTEWHRVAYFGKLAEIAGEYLKKGALIQVIGRLQTRKWQDKDGADKYSTEIVGQQLLMLGSKDRAAGREAPPQDRDEGVERTRNGTTGRTAPKTGGKFDDFEDDIPF